MSILSICRAARKVTDEELAEMETMARGQASYIRPLKLATQARQNALGKHNLSVLEKLRELRDTIKAGENLARSK